MSETSGFFEAIWDESLVNSDGGLGDWDRKYYASQFADYFKLFFSNGVFNSPENQLKIVVTDDYTVSMLDGYAFINGYWYHNDEMKEFSVLPNDTTVIRTDCIKIRYDISSRKISAVYGYDDASVSRSGNYYELKLAEINVPPSSLALSSSSIVDTREDSNVCGFFYNNVRGEFNQIVNMIGILALLETTNKTNLVEAINEIAREVNAVSSGMKNIVFAAEEPQTVPTNTIVMVYEE